MELKIFGYELDHHGTFQLNPFRNSWEAVECLEILQRCMVNCSAAGSLFWFLTNLYILWLKDKIKQTNLHILEYSWWHISGQMELLYYDLRTPSSIQFWQSGVLHLTDRKNFFTCIKNIWDLESSTCIEKICDLENSTDIEKICHLEYFI